jgi:hypothetical protein
VASAAHQFQPASPRPAPTPCVRGSLVWRDKLIIELLEKISRHRDLDEDESALMERTVRRVTPRRAVWRWTQDEDKLLKAFIRRRARVGRPKPFQRNDEVRELAARMNRTYMAVHRRIERLRKCSHGKRKAKG